VNAAWLSLTAIAISSFKALTKALEEKQRILYPSLQTHV
jgi:hypothetical protein